MKLSTLRWLWLPLALLFALPASAQYNNPVTIAGNFVDISTTGTSLPTGDEVLSPTISVATSGFSFPYFGTSRTEFKMSSNGFITFNTATTSATFTNGVLPSTTAPNAVVAPFWDDLDVIGATDPGQFYLVDTANDRLIVQWSNLRRYVSAGINTGSLTFQIHLYGDGTVEYHYGTLVEPGLSYTVGLENDAGTIGQLRIFNGAGDAVRSNSGVRFTLATGPVPFSAQRVFNLANAGACTGFSRSVNFSVSNQGVGPLTITGATVSGSSAFGTTGVLVGTTPTPFPVTVNPGTSVGFPISFNPTAAQSDVQTATVTLQTDGGPLAFDVSGTADAEGAGYVYRSSLSTGTCGNTVATPGTGLVSLAGHTRITTWTTGNADDGRFALNLGTTFGNSFPSFRLFGLNNAVLYITPNGVVSTSSTVSTTFYGALPTNTTAIQVAAMNLTVAAAVEADNTGEFGAPGVFYGLTDVDGDGVQELVITWWHAYDVGSTPGPNGQYLTAQVVLKRGARANEEGIVEMRFPDGVDGNSVAYRQNTNVSDSASDTAIENDAVTGISEGSGAEASIYRLRNGAAGTGPILGGSLYAPGGGSLGVRFEAETQAMAMGQAGWRMMGPPVRNFSVNRLSGLNLVQAVTGQYPDFPSANVYPFYDGAAYVPATNVTNALVPGRGFIWYLFNEDITPDPTSFGNGTSLSYALPMKLQATGAEAPTSFGAVGVQLFPNGDGFNLVANPFRDDLDISNLGSFATGGTLNSTVAQVWDPNVGETGSYVAVSGSISAWQGFFLETTPGPAGATLLSIPVSARNVTGTFLGRTAGYAQNPAQPRLGFELASTLSETGRASLDRAATLVFAADAETAWDLLDATKLAPLADAYATIGFQGIGPDGAARVKAQESRPTEGTSFSVPLVIDAVGTESAMSLAWSGIEALPAAWRLELRDLATGAVVDLRTAGSYAFEHEADPARTLSNDEIVARTTTAAQVKAASPHRFELVVTQSIVSTGEASVTAYALAAAAPNPVRDVARVRFALPEAGAVQVGLYDLLGRQVATLAAGERGAGWHEATVDVRALSAGVYVVRMEAGTFVQSQRLTVVR